MATAIDIIAKATSYLGTAESPKNSNNVIFNTHYYGKTVSGSAYPWCCAYVWDIFRMCDASHLFYGGKKTAYCPTVENYYKSIGRYYGKTEGKAGDLCLMDFGKGRASHIGIVEKKNTDGSYTVIEGNTSTSSNDNGGNVMRRTRKTNVIRGFARPAYDEKNALTSSINPTTPKKYTKKKFIKNVQSAIGVTVDGIVGIKTLSALPTVSKSKNRKHKVVKYIQKYLNAKGYDCGIEDGVAGKKFHSAVKKYQKLNNLTSDGVVGINTWKKLFGI